MRKRVRKLKLNRETLRQLDLHLSMVVGGTNFESCGDVCDLNPVEPTTQCGWYTAQCGPVYTGPFYAGCPSYGAYCTVGC